MKHYQLLADCELACVETAQFLGEPSYESNSNYLAYKNKAAMLNDLLNSTCKI
jgi:hypothetical protein